MKSVIMLLSCLTLGAANIDPPIKHDMFLFETPFLIGKWHIINPNLETRNSDEFLSITLLLESNYRFRIWVRNKDHTVKTWSGDYSADEHNLVIGLSSSSPQTFEYNVNPSQLILNGVTMTKILPRYLSGYWRSSVVKGDDVSASKISEIDLVLYPNFYFSIQSFTYTGMKKYRDGVYYIEDNNIYFIFDDGEQESQFALKRDQLFLTNEDSDTYIAFHRGGLD
ncbi:hypothetical protein [Vibrio gangliei]|uniref:hypothetical protein n=1 Tax=Vibrio gangliei TaxID=2077090 RepID=UPI000D01CD55|nr:hypothetical protein [Vibrio gangliei]